MARPIGLSNRLEEMKAFLRDGKSIQYITDYFQVDQMAIRYHLRKNKLINWKKQDRSCSKSPNTQYGIDEEYFDKIDSEEKAYLLGFLYADGYNDDITRTVRIGLSAEDREILFKFQELLKTDRPIRYDEYRLKDSSMGAVATLYITNNHISKRLTELGCMRAKSLIIEWPKFIKPEFERSFLRGYFDGDGCIWLCKSQNRQGNKVVTEKLSISIVSTEPFVSYIRDNILRPKLGILLKGNGIRGAHKGSDTKAFELFFSGNNQAERFLDYIYKDSNIYLDRKYGQYIDFKNEFLPKMRLLKKVRMRNRTTLMNSFKGKDLIVA